MTISNTPERRAGVGAWPLERVLFALAGTVVLVAMLLTLLVSKWFGVLAGFVGANMWLYVIFGACPTSLLLRRTCHLRSAVYEQPQTPARRRSAPAAS